MSGYKIGTIGHAMAACEVGTMERNAVNRGLTENETALALASIKRNAADFSDAVKVAEVYAYGCDLSASGKYGKETISVRKSELMLLLDNPALIPDGAKSRQGVVKLIRDSKLTSIERAERALAVAVKALERATTAHAEAVADLERVIAEAGSGDILGQELEEVAA